MFPHCVLFFVVGLENTDIANWISSLLSRCFSQFVSWLYCRIAQIFAVPRKPHYSFILQRIWPQILFSPYTWCFSHPRLWCAPSPPADRAVFGIVLSTASGNCFFACATPCIVKPHPYVLERVTLFQPFLVAFRISELF